MPHGDNLDILREIRAIEPDLPVIVVTSGVYSPAGRCHDNQGRIRMLLMVIGNHRPLNNRPWLD